MISDLKGLGARLWLIFKSVLLGQVLSMLLCGTGVTSQYLQTNFNVNIPTAQIFFNYLLLATVFTTIVLLRRRQVPLWKTIKENGWKYFLVAIIDVEGNYILVKAYRFTTLTSIQILDCFSLVVVVLMSRVFLKVHYRPTHWLGIVISIIGLGLLIYSDASQSGQSEMQARDRLIGDILCIAAASLYGIGNVSQEYLVKTFDPIDFLAFLGVFSSIISGIQLWVFEYEELLSLPRHEHLASIIGLVCAFNLIMFVFYSSMAFVLRWSNATAVNLSILSADFYALIAGIYLFGFSFHTAYIISFAGILVGVAIYHLKEAPRGQGGEYSSPSTSQGRSTDSSSQEMGLEAGRSDGNISASLPATEWVHESLYPSLPKSQSSQRKSNSSSSVGPVQFPKF